MRLERRADALLRALELQRAGDDAAHVAQLAPFLGKRLVAPGRRHLAERARDAPTWRRRPSASQASSAVKHSIGASQRHRAAEQLIEHGEAGLARRATNRIAIERILADIEIERRKIDRHEGAERGEDALVVEIRVGLAHQRVELGEPMQHQPLELRHFFDAGRDRPRGNARGCRASSAACCAACGRSRPWS